MKFSWGTGILIFLIMFLTACGIFIAFAMSQENSLVHKDYYNKGADYTKQMEINKRSVKYLNTIYFQDKDQQISIFFPENFTENLKTGEILFFRPSDINNDLKIEMKPVNNIQSVDKINLIKGRYLVKFSWQSDTEYYIEKEIFVK